MAYSVVGTHFLLRSLEINFFEFSCAIKKRKKLFGLTLYVT